MKKITNKQIKELSKKIRDLKIIDIDSFDNWKKNIYFIFKDKKDVLSNDCFINYFEEYLKLSNEEKTKIKVIREVNKSPSKKSKGTISNW